MVEVELGNSEGLEASYTKANLRTAVRFTFPTNQGLFTHYYGATAGTAALEPEEIAANASKVASWASRTLPLESCEGPVILAPGALSVLLQALRAGVSARRRLRGSSPLIGKLEEKVVSEEVSIHDRPRLDFGGASAPFDAEGVATYDKPLFANGLFKGFIYDLASAYEAGTRSTGNAGRNCHDAPEPVCTNLVMEPGDRTLEAMVSGVEAGLLVTDVLSGGSSNVVTGDFSFDTTSAFVVRDGEIQGRADRGRITGNVYEALSTVSAIESSLHLTGTDWLPHIRFDRLSVSSEKERGSGDRRGSGEN
jgi:PmbA protein